MSLPWRSRFLYGVDNEIEYVAELSVRPWVPATPVVGGSRTAASGVPASHVVRRDSNLFMTLRITEQEWVDVDLLLEWGQLSETFLWYPDADDGAAYEVYLESPLAGETVDPRRGDTFEHIYELTIGLRLAAPGTRWDLHYFPEG